MANSPLIPSSCQSWVSATRARTRAVGAARRGLCDLAQGLELGGGDRSVVVDVEGQIRYFVHALDEALDREVRVPVLREAPERRSKLSPVEEASPVLDALDRLQSPGVEVLVGLRHPEEPFLRPGSPVQPRMELRAAEGRQVRPKAGLQAAIRSDEAARRAAARFLVLALGVDDREVGLGNVDRLRRRLGLGGRLRVRSSDIAVDAET